MRAIDPADRARQRPPSRMPLRFVAIINVVANSTRRSVSLNEMHEALKVPKSSLLTLLNPMVATGYLNRERRRYSLGSSALRLSSSILVSWDLTSAMRPYLEELARCSQEFSYLCVLNRNTKLVTYIDVIESQYLIRYSVKKGSVSPLHERGVGRVLLAFADSAWRKNYFASLRQSGAAGESVELGSDVAEELRQLKRSRLAVRIGELAADSASISAPVSGADGLVAGAIGIALPSERLYGQRHKLQRLVGDIAARASGDIISAERFTRGAGAVPRAQPPRDRLGLS